MNSLLVIDMQTTWLSSAAERFDKDGVIARINRAARAMRERGDQVIFVRHSNDEAPIDSAAWQIDPRLVVEQGDVMVEKLACDPFAGTALGQHLAATATRTVFICGLATEFCVDSALRAALSNGFDVVGLADAHTTGDRPHLKAAQIIEHHNWTWASLAVPTGRAIRVCTVEQAFAV